LKYKQHRRDIIETVNELLGLIESIPDNKEVSGAEYIEKYSRGHNLRGHWVSYAADMLSTIEHTNNQTGGTTND